MNGKMLPHLTVVAWLTGCFVVDTGHEPQRLTRRRPNGIRGHTSCDARECEAKGGVNGRVDQVRVAAGDERGRSVVSGPLAASIEAVPVVWYTGGIEEEPQVFRVGIGRG